MKMFITCTWRVHESNKNKKRIFICYIIVLAILCTFVCDIVSTKQMYNISYEFMYVLCYGSMRNK